MNNSQARLELRIDVFEKTNQLALALASQRPPELVEAILQEFHEIEYLGTQSDSYRLLKADRISLDDTQAISEQLAQGDHLTLIEHECPLPEGTLRPFCPIYLREASSNKVYRIPWLPAIIGRADEDLPLNERIAVDLETHPNGLRVSRRHVMLTQENGCFYLTNLSANPTAIQNRHGQTIDVLAEKQPLQHGDTLHLVRSEIKLKLIMRTSGL